MTRAEYLKARGWHYEIDGSTWANPTGGFLSTGDAVTVQLARDAEEERRAWDGYYGHAIQTVTAMILGGGKVETKGPPADNVEEAAALVADGMMESRRARRAVELTD